MSYKDERDAIIDVTKGGRCYYLTVRLLIHPLSVRIVYLANRLKLHPDVLSLMSFVFSFLCLSFFYFDYYLGAFICFYIRTIFDYSDGALARYSRKLSENGKWLDRIGDEIFYTTLWLFIAFKTGSLKLGIYFLLSILFYRLVVDIIIIPRIHLLKKRAAVKQFFINHGIILGFGVCTKLEFWVLVVFCIGVPKYYIVLPTLLCNLDLMYRIYEFIKFGTIKINQVS